MARNQETITLRKADVWVMVTDNDVEAISLQVLQGEIQLRIGGTDKPADDARGQTNRLYDGALQAPLNRIAFNGGGARVWMKANGQQAAMAWINHP
jgi:hypothetical protein